MTLTEQQLIDLDDLDLPFVSFTSDEYQADPHGVWRRAREQSWLARTEIAVNVIPYKANFEMMRTRQLTTMGDTIMRIQGVLDGPMYRYWTDGLIMCMNDLRHARLRKLLFPAFTPHSVDRFRPMMREVVHRLVGEFRERGECDFVKEFSHRYPVEIMARLLGLPTDDIDVYGQWAVDIGLLFSFPVAPVADRVEKAISNLYEYAGKLIEDRRRNPGDDLLTTLIQVEEDGERLTYDELRWQVVNLTFAGHDTTKNSTTFLMRLFCEHPDQWQKLREDPGLANNAIDEGMRFDPVIPATMRTTVEDFVYDGVRFPPGTPIMLRADTSNRDPAVFDDPDVFDITRRNADKQITFGGGVHYCLGANLARAELQEALPILAEAMPDVRIVGEADWRARSSMLLGAESLPVAFR
jgi:hypothetical protein